MSVCSRLKERRVFEVQREREKEVERDAETERRRDTERHGERLSKGCTG